jgi:hypothetical protein
MAWMIILPCAYLVSVAAMRGLAWPEDPSQRFSWTLIDVVEIVPWAIALALLSMSSMRLWQKAAVGTVSVPYSMLAYEAGGIVFDSVLALFL